MNFNSIMREVAESLIVGSKEDLQYLMEIENSAIEAALDEIQASIYQNDIPKAFQQSETVTIQNPG